MDARELLTSNLPLIESAVAFVCRRYRFAPEEADELAGVVNLKLVENDYAILRAYEQRCSLATYIGIVVQRLALDYRTHAWGKWHPSNEAKRLGPLAIELEQLLRRDGRSLSDATALLIAKHGVPAAEIETLAVRLPDRTPRHREVALDEASRVTRSDEAIEERTLAGDRRRVSERVSSVVSDTIARLPEQDRLILQLRFEGGMRVVEIARMLRIEQKLLYRRIEQRAGEIRKEIQRAGLDAGDVLDLVGRDGVDLDFQLGKPEARPSIPLDETAVAQSEDSP